MLVRHEEWHAESRCQNVLNMCCPTGSMKSKADAAISTEKVGLKG